MIAGDRRSGGTDPILSTQRIPRGRDPDFLYTKNRRGRDPIFSTQRIGGGDLEENGHFL